MVVYARMERGRIFNFNYSAKTIHAIIGCDRKMSSGAGRSCAIHVKQNEAAPSTASSGEGD